VFDFSHLSNQIGSLYQWGPAYMPRQNQLSLLACFFPLANQFHNLLTAGYKVWRNLAVGLGFSHVGSDADVAIAASVPDPNFFDRLRGVTGVSPGANYSENAFHFQGTWMVPVTDTLDVGFSFGPSIFRVSQDIPTGVAVNEPGPTLASTTIVNEDKTAAGFNLGVDVNYFFTPRFGAGVLARYTRGSVDFDNATDSLTVGGFQFGVGARVRF
jgi:hypothetical protein